VLLPNSLRAEIALIGTAHLAGDATDRSGLTDVLEGGIPENRLGGISAIEYTGEGDRYLLVSDRGPADGAATYRCRFHDLKLAVQPGNSPPVAATLVATTLLADESGRNLTGSFSAFDKNDPAKSLLFDPEGLRTDRRDRVFVSDEYGPGVYQFSTEGRRTAVLKVPRRFQIARPSAVAAEEAAWNSSGRQTNGGLEGLAFGPDLPDGRRLLIVAIDNDFIAAKPILLQAFAIDRNELPGFGWQPQ
jgi:hypothetical protein